MADDADVGIDVAVACRVLGVSRSGVGKVAVSRR